jgi:hypothetical protein
MSSALAANGGHASRPNGHVNNGHRDGARSNGKSRRPEPNPLGGNFILMPSLLEYLSPDLTLPEQYFLRQRNDDGMGAEKSLMYAVLKDGIRCFYKHVGSKRRKYRKMSVEAEEWILDDSYDYAFGFRVICDTLGIDADCLRQRLLAWKDTELRRREMTGDTRTIQVGRSPFPTAVADLGLDLDADDDDGDEDDSLSDDDELAAGAEESSDAAWNTVEHTSLEELRLEEHDRPY